MSCRARTARHWPSMPFPMLQSSQSDRSSRPLCRRRNRPLRLGVAPAVWLSTTSDFQTRIQRSWSVDVPPETLLEALLLRFLHTTPSRSEAGPAAEHRPRVPLVSRLRALMLKVDEPRPWRLKVWGPLCTAGFPASGLAIRHSCGILSVRVLTSRGAAWLPHAGRHCHVETCGVVAFASCGRGCSFGCASSAVVYGARRSGRRRCREPGPWRFSGWSSGDRQRQRHPG